MFLHVSVIVDVCEVYVYRPQRSCGQGNIFTPVCHSVHGGGFLPQCVMGCHPPTPPDQTPPGSRPPRPPRTRPPPREADSSIRSTIHTGTHPTGMHSCFTCVSHSVHRVGGYLDRYPPGTRYTLRTRYPPGTRYAPGSSTCWEIPATSGRYAYYWNAFLFIFYIHKLGKQGNLQSKFPGTFHYF